MNTMRNVTTHDPVLGGRLQLRQPRHGHRVGHDAILLAAATQAKPGERVIELGSGVGAAGLALASRVPGVRVTLVEIDPRLAELAEENVRSNGCAEWVGVVVLDVAAGASAYAAAGLRAGVAARVLMNPPFNDPLRHKPSPDVDRHRARCAPLADLAVWVRCAARLLTHRGVLTLIWRADGLDRVLAALAGRFGGATVRPVHPRPDQPAIRVLVRATKASRAPFTLLPGLILADPEGRPTKEAEAVLRGAALPLQPD